VDLLGAKDFGRYQELCNKYAFDYDCEENRLTDWKNLLNKFDPDDEDIGSSDYEGQSDLRDDIKSNSKVMRERVIAYDQLKAFSLYLEDKPELSAAYRKFLVSMFSFCMIYYCRDNNLTPSLFYRCTTVVRLPQKRRPDRHWCLPHRGNSSRPRWWKIWKLRRPQ
jgi:hypothetical protein